MIYILGGIHCDKKLYKQIIKVLKKTKPDLVCLEELTHDKDVINACNDFVEGRINLSKFLKITNFEKYWFDFSSYEELFIYLKRNKIRIYPIDHKLEKRIKLIKLEKKILKELEKNKPIGALKEKEEKVSVFDRENEMVVNISKGIKRFGSVNTCVIVGINHTKRIRESLLSIDHRVQKVDISDKRSINRHLNRMHEYAVKNRIEDLKIPPLVSIFALVFKKIEKVVK